MVENKNQHPNDLVLYRQRLGLTQKEVAHRLGHRNTARVSKHELGQSIPTLISALELSAVYRAPIEFLFSQITLSQREKVRAKELKLHPVGQGTLFNENL